MNGNATRNGQLVQVVHNRAGLSTGFVSLKAKFRRRALTRLGKQPRGGAAGGNESLGIRRAFLNKSCEELCNMWALTLLI